MTKELPLPSLVFLYGLAGVGKNFCADAIAQAFGYVVYDLDNDLSSEMRAAIKEGRAFTDEMRDDFFSEISKTLRVLKQKHPRVIVTQGAYKRRHRDGLLLDHPELTFLWIDASTDTIVRQLRERGDSVSPEYAEMISRNFEPPECGLRFLNEDVDATAIGQQFQMLIGREWRGNDRPE